MTQQRAVAGISQVPAYLAPRAVVAPSCQDGASRRPRLDLFVPTCTGTDLATPDMPGAGWPLHGFVSLAEPIPAGRRNGIPASGPRRSQEPST
jgi:hypothetical protein